MSKQEKNGKILDSILNIVIWIVVIFSLVISIMS